MSGHLSGHVYPFKICPQLNKQMSLVILIAVILVCFWIFKHLSSKLVILDGQPYHLDTNSTHVEAQKIHKMHQTLKKIMAHIEAQPYTTLKPEIERLLKKFNGLKWSEHRPGIGSTLVAFNENKHRISVCLTEPTTKKPVADDILLMVALHELAHCMSEAYDPSNSAGETVHSAGFRACEKYLVETAERLGYLQVDSLQGKSYCGVKL